ncbi:MAG: response regulator [Chloroflexota bacterium]
MNPKLRILIVDDDRRMTRTLADILSLAGYEAVEASSAEQAIQLAETQALDCVLTDFKMPGKNGVELHRELQQAHPGLPVVLMTAYAADELIRQGLEEGIVAALDKPLDMAQLLNFFALLTRTRTVTIVDDDPAFCQTLGDILAARGFTVTKITDPHTDMDALMAESQVVLLDMKLNSLSGLDVLKTIRAKYPRLPVLLVTGYRQEMADAVQAALAISAHACLYKPLEIPKLLETLSGVQLSHLREAIHSNE